MAASKRAERIPSIANTFLAKAFEVARRHAIETLIVQADDHRDIRAVEKARDSENILWLTTVADHPLSGLDNELVLPVPAVALKTNSQLQLALCWRFSTNTSNSMKRFCASALAIPVVVSTR